MPQGMFPFTPIAHSDTAVDYGFVKGKQYTLKWSAAPKMTGNNTCQGDRSQGLIDVSNKRGAENRGFYGAGANASVSERSGCERYTCRVLPGGKQHRLPRRRNNDSQRCAPIRIGQDTDSSSQNFANYRGNGRRITTVPVTDSVNGSRVVGYARFFLLTASNYNQAQGNEPWCGEFIGIGAPEGGDTEGGNTAVAVTRVRLWN